MRAGLVALTGFGDTAVLMPLAAVMLLWLLVMRSPRGAVWWAITVAFCVGMTALLKVSFYGCPPTPDLHSPSGHTSLSTLVYGAMTLVTANETGGVRRIMAVSGGTGFILAIAASRLLLHAHSAAEVSVGLVMAIDQHDVDCFGRLGDVEDRVGEPVGDGDLGAVEGYFVRERPAGPLDDIALDTSVPT